jgi:hypothetical protein
MTKQRLDVKLRNGTVSPHTRHEEANIILKLDIQSLSRSYASVLVGCAIKRIRRSVFIAGWQ